MHDPRPPAVLSRQPEGHGAKVAHMLNFSGRTPIFQGPSRGTVEYASRVCSASQAEAECQF